LATSVDWPQLDLGVRWKSMDPSGQGDSNLGSISVTLRMGKEFEFVWCCNIDWSISFCGLYAFNLYSL